MLDIKPNNLKYLLFFGMLQVSISITACVVAYRFVGIGSLILPGPPFIFPLSYVVSDIVAELYGPKLAKTIIIISLLCEFFFAIVVKIIIRLPSPDFWVHEENYFIIFDPLLGFIVAGTIAVLASSWINVNFLQKLKIKWNGRRFVLRSISSSALGGFCLVGLTMIFGYSTEVSISQLFNMGASVYLLELMYAVAFAVPARYVIGYIRLKERHNEN